MHVGCRCALCRIVRNKLLGPIGLHRFAGRLGFPFWICLYHTLEVIVAVAVGWFERTVAGEAGHRCWCPCWRPRPASVFCRTRGAWSWVR